MSGTLGLFPGLSILDLHRLLWLCLVACPVPTLPLWTYLISLKPLTEQRSARGTASRTVSFGGGKRKPTLIPCLPHARLEAHATYHSFSFWYFGWLRWHSLGKWGWKVSKRLKNKVCVAFIAIASIVLYLTGKCLFYHRMSFTKLREFSFKINGID